MRVRVRDINSPFTNFLSSNQIFDEIFMRRDGRIRVLADLGSPILLPVGLNAFMFEGLSSLGLQSIAPAPLALVADPTLIIEVEKPTLIAFNSSAPPFTGLFLLEPRECPLTIRSWTPNPFFWQAPDWRTIGSRIRVMETD